MTIQGQNKFHASGFSYWEKEFRNAQISAFAASSKHIICEVKSSKLIIWTSDCRLYFISYIDILRKPYISVCGGGDFLWDKIPNAHSSKEEGFSLVTAHVWLVWGRNNMVKGPGEGKLLIPRSPGSRGQKEELGREKRTLLCHTTRACLLSPCQPPNDTVYYYSSVDQSSDKNCIPPSESHTSEHMRLLWDIYDDLNHNKSH